MSFHEPSHDESRFDTGGFDTSGADQPTEQIRRPLIPRLPGSLDPTRRRERRDGATQEPDPTDVLPLDEIFGAPEPPADQADVAAGPVAAGEAAPVAGPGRAPMPVVPVTSATAARTDGGLAARVRADYAAALRSGSDWSREWLLRGDNAVIIVTALMAVLLLCVVATLG